MTAAALGAAWAAAVLVLGARGPEPRLSRGRDATTHRAQPGYAPGSVGRRGAAVATLVATLVVPIGAALRRAGGRQADADADRRTGWAVVAALATLWLSPALAALPPLVAVAAPALSARRSARHHEAAVVDQVPDLVDLLTITATAGLPVSAALVALGPRAGGVLGPALERTAAMLARGGTVAEALDELADAGGAPLRPLIDALAEHDRYGSALRPALERVAIDARLRRRREAEEAARRLPVTLLFPLVLTTLPAFALLTVVPLLAGSLGSMSL